MIKALENDVLNKLKNDQKRLDHVLAVTAMAVSLAKLNGVSTEKATIAGLYHDYAKNDSIDEQKTYLSAYLIKRYTNLPEAYHGFAAAKILEKKYDYHNQEVLDAIRYHTTSKGKISKLGKIIFVSDYAEHNRCYADAELVREVAYYDLEEAYKLALISKTDYIKKSGHTIDNNQYAALKEVIKDDDLLSITVTELENLKVKDLKIFDFEKSNPFYDYFVIATINDRQGMAAITNIKKAIKDKIKHIEGKTGWILIDAGSVIIHLFKESEREFYGFDHRFLGIKRIR